MSQSVFFKGEVVKNDLNVSLEDLKLLGQWKRRRVMCPWCLWEGPLSDFSLLIQGKRGLQAVSRKRVYCPDCYVTMNMKSFMRTQDMSVRDYAVWFWDAVFAWGGWRRISQAARDRYFLRVKLWDYRDRDEFWGVYRMFKGGQTRDDVEADDEDFRDYQRQFEDGDIG